MKTSAEIRAVHPAVTGQEPAAFTKRETVDLVVTEELLLAGHQAGGHHCGLVMVGAGEVPQVGQAGRGQRPLEAAVTQQGVAGQLKHLARSCQGKIEFKSIVQVFRKYIFWLHTARIHPNQFMST